MQIHIQNNTQKYNLIISLLFKAYFDFFKEHRDMLLEIS